MSQEATIKLATAASFFDDAFAATQKHLHDPDALSAERPELFSLIAMASKQIAEAEHLDPHATHTYERDGGQRTLSIPQLKAMALYYEALVLAPIGQEKKALPLLDRALQYDPEFAKAYYLKGVALTGLMDKQSAIDAFNKALAIEPADIDTRKALERAKMITGSQRALYATSKAAETTSNFIFYLSVVNFLGWGLVFVMGLYSFSQNQPGQGLGLTVGAILLWIMFQLILNAFGWIADRFR